MKTMMQGWESVRKNSYIWINFSVYIFIAVIWNIPICKCLRYNYLDPITQLLNVKDMP